MTLIRAVLYTVTSEGLEAKENSAALDLECKQDDVVSVSIFDYGSFVHFGRQA